MAIAKTDLSKNLFDLSGYCSVVTGAGMGIGLAFAEGLARAGSAVVLVDINPEHLEKAVDHIRGLGGKVSSLVVDVSAEDAPAQIVKAALDLNGSIDVLINNAAIMSFAHILEVTDVQWDKLYNINLRAPMRIMRSVIPEMIKNGRGSIINIGSSWSSRASIFGFDAGGVEYCSAKAALQCLSRAAAQDVGSNGVRVNCIAPGPVDTPMHADHRDDLYAGTKFVPVGRMEFAEDLVGAAIFLASDASLYITGQTLHVNGGSLMVD